MTDQARTVAGAGLAWARLQGMRRPSPASLVAWLVICLDAMTKTWVVEPSRFAEPTTNAALLLEVARFDRWLTAGLALIALVGFGFFLARLGRAGLVPPWVRGLLVGGATGNVIDRIVLGAVRDFIATPWVVFNLADVALVVGTVGYLAHVAVNGRFDPAESMVRRRHHVAQSHVKRTATSPADDAEVNETDGRLRSCVAPTHKTTTLQNSRMRSWVGCFDRR